MAIRRPMSILSLVEHAAACDGSVGAGGVLFDGYDAHDRMDDGYVSLASVPLMVTK